MIGKLTFANLWDTFKNNIIAVIVIIGLTLGSVTLYYNFIYTPKYESSAQVLLNTKESKKTQQTEGLKANIQLMNTYTAVIKSGSMLDLVKKELKLKTPLNQLVANTTVESDLNSLVVKITYTGTDKKAVSQTMEVLVKKIQKEIPKTFGETSVKIVEHPTEVRGEDHLGEYFFAIIIGVFLSAIMILLLTMFKKTITSKDQIEDMEIDFLNEF